MLVSWWLSPLLILSDTPPPSLHPVLDRILSPKAFESEDQANLRPYYAATIVMVVGCVGGWVGACMIYVQHFSFGGVWWGGRWGEGRGGSVVLTETH